MLSKLSAATAVEAELAKSHAQGSAASLLQRSSADRTPTVEVSLAPPAKPLPNIAAEISSLDASREAFEAMKMSETVHAFNTAVKNAALRIGKLFGVEDKALSMLQDVVSFKVNVIPGTEPAASAKSKIDAVERTRADMATKMFDNAAAEFEGITDFVVAVLKKELARSKGTAAFLGLPAHVKVVAGDVPYPTVASLVSDMEARRDVSEGLAMARFLELDMALVKVELAMVKKLAM
jgi:hypothetical protein